MQLLLRPQPRAGDRHGAAMLLVLIGLFTATILTAAYVSSRDNSAAIGDNIVASEESKWIATTGLDLAVSILRNKPDWRDVHVKGRLLESYPFGTGIIHIDLMDIATELPPTDQTTMLKLTVTATVENIERTSAMVVEISTVGGSGGDVDLSEFALFAMGNINMRNNATLARWPTAPLSDMGKRIMIATRTKSAGSINLDDDAAALDTTAYTAPGASALLIDEGNGPVIARFDDMLDDIPVPDPPDDGIADPGGAITSPLTLNGADQALAIDSRWRSAMLRNTDLLLDGAVTLTVDEDLSIVNGSLLTVDGAATMVIFNQFELRDSAIELVGDSTLRLFVAGDLTIDDSFIGEDRHNSGAMDASGTATYMDPDRIRVYSIPLTTPTWQIVGASVVKASIYAPTAIFSLTDQSALYGRVAAQQITIDVDATVFYDPGLDSGLGYTTVDSPLYMDDGHIVDEAVNLVALTDDGTITMNNAQSSKPLGACCVVDHCWQTTEDWCIEKGGVFRGDASTCDTVQCSGDIAMGEGACCKNGSCAIVTSETCLSIGGTFLDAGTRCDVDCTSVGACCFVDFCFLVDQAMCDSHGGLYFKDDKCALIDCNAELGVAVADDGSNEKFTPQTTGTVVGSGTTDWEATVR